MRTVFPSDPMPTYESWRQYIQSITTAMTQYNFWYENKSDKHFTLSLEPILSHLEAWLYSRELAWLRYYGSDATFRCFLGDKSGLGSVYEENEYKEMFEHARKIIVHFTSTVEKVADIIKADIKKTYKQNAYAAAVMDMLDKKGGTCQFVHQMVLAQRDNNAAFVEIYGSEIAELILTLPVVRDSVDVVKFVSK